MAACPACGYRYEGRFKFCPECAAPLTTAARPPAEERKVVTALFCDLIGFTATSESADPEDVGRRLTSYFSIARNQIEGHGGVVEKFIGDAVVGVFGVPVNHEDDPERAVRAGLRIIEDVREFEEVDGESIRLRVGVNTGEALVRLGLDPGSGEGFLAGDAINTASRLQTVAPEMGVAVGLGTYEATSVIFEYEELDRATLKGKSEPVRVFHAKAPRARFGTDLTRTHDTPFIGREIDLALLKGIFDKTIASGSVQLVTVVGEPGLGKSRLAAELFADMDSRPELITWRQGRCLPYGEGITFWALGEILKAHAGILESDPLDVATTKLDAVLPEGPERAWFRQRLLPLLGIEASSPAERAELFTAWRRFLEHIAERSPTVLVFEDLHWADDAMLAFLEHLVGHAEGVPLLVVGTARPELFERHADFGAGLRNTNHINLAPLSKEETGRLISALLRATVLPEALQQPIVDRASGNPLYAEEFVRLLRDRDMLVRKGPSWELKEGADFPLPNSVQALISARLDTLTSDTKSLLADAAVVGKVFWAGAVKAMGERDPTAVAEVLRELSRKELVRPARRSSIEGESEHSFWHALTRDVAYAQLPRAARAERHVAAAAWIESTARGRLEDLAEVLAYHYGTAMELARAAGNAEQAALLETPTLRFLTLAGDRALGLDTATAVASFERALALTPAGHPERPKTLILLGVSLFQSGRSVEAAETLEEAIASLRERGDLREAARAMVKLGPVFIRLGDTRWTELPMEALALLEPLPPGPELVEVLGELAHLETVQGRYEAGIRYAEGSLALAAELGLSRPARTLGFLGYARSQSGEPAGLENMREAIAIATEGGQAREVTLLHNNYGMEYWGYEGPAASLEIFRAGIAFANVRGLTEAVHGLTGSSLDLLVDAGELDAALDAAASIEWVEGEDVWDLLVVRGAKARILALRGVAGQAASWLDWLESTSRGVGSPEIAVIGLASSAFARAALGEDEAAIGLLTEIGATPGTANIGQMYAALLPAMVRTVLAVGDRTLAERLVENCRSRAPQTQHALVAANAALTESRGDPQAAADAYAEAADRWARFGAVPERAFALLGQGRCLVGLGRRAEAIPVLQRAREIFARLSAAPALAETDAQLASE